MASITPSSCENPQYPNWMWRYNRNQHLTKFEPRFTRVERWPPHYRNMGVHDRFPFHPTKHDSDDQALWRPGLSYAKQLVEGRQSGFGNSALGLVPGPAPPRFIRREVYPYKIGELLKINCLENVTEGAFLHDHSAVPVQVPGGNVAALNPREYLQKTLGQPLEFPGTFPHINGAAPRTDVGSATCCGVGANAGITDPLAYWLESNRHREADNPIERWAIARPYPEYCCEYGWDPETVKCRELQRQT
ncbi:hypothetical protein ElyMa_002156700 [Elysia marginata]|uniref:Uncharacterized protein n=1 Tax=Elysia marginata TaxID=1093978 RepID=A0AAV4FLN1_9GAST|nr:hypothetical protein ElyMa_002156700 [Elysia marginata]